MSNDMLELELDKLEKRGINRYKAVLMAAKEARFINDQIRLDIVSGEQKPSTVALRRLFDGRVVEDNEQSQEG